MVKMRREMGKEAEREMAEKSENSKKQKQLMEIKKNEIRACIL